MQTSDALAHRFTLFAQECRGSSPLYERLALGVATDGDLLSLAAHARPEQPPANMLFGAVHFLLLEGVDHPLSAFFPDIVVTPDSGDPLPALRDFCLSRREEIISILERRSVQTNEVRRSALLLPAFATISAVAPNAPLAIIEIGTSAGLNLRWDRYGYHYNGQRCGDLESPVQLMCEARGSYLPPVPERLPVVSWRRGIDKHPIDVRDAAAVAWLRALIWPEHAERVALLARAVQVAQQEPPPLMAGDGLELLSEAIAAPPEMATLVVYDTFTVNQFAPEQRKQLYELLEKHAQHRTIHRVSIGWNKGESPTVRLTSYGDGPPVERTLARCEPHGAWIEWLE